MKQRIYFNAKNCEQMKCTSLTVGGDEDVFVRWKHDCLCVSGGAYSLTSIYAARSQPLFPLSLLTTTNSQNHHHQYQIPKHTSQFSSAFLVKFVNSNSEPYTTSRYFHWTYSLQIPFIVNFISLILSKKMPKKKTGQRKKAEKQKLRQKEIRSGKETKPLCDWACNSTMVNFNFQLNTGFLISFYVK